MRIFGLVTAGLILASNLGAQGDTAKTPTSTKPAVQTSRAGLPFYDKGIRSKQLYAWLVENGGSKNGVSLYTSPEEILTAWKTAFPDELRNIVNRQGLAKFIRESQAVSCPVVETNLAYVDKNTRKVVLTGWQRTLGIGDNEGEMCLERYGRIYASLLCGNIIPRLWIETTPAPAFEVSDELPVASAPPIPLTPSKPSPAQALGPPAPALKDTVWLPRYVTTNVPRGETPLVTVKEIHHGFPFWRTVFVLALGGTAYYYTCENNLGSKWCPGRSRTTTVVITNSLRW